MGANVTFPAVRTAAKCLSTVSATVEDDHKSGKHSAAKSTEDIKLVVACLVEHRILHHQPDREHATYPRVAADLLENVNLVELQKWLTTQKARASREM
jgi:hypothetical protein